MTKTAVAVLGTTAVLGLFLHFGAQRAPGANVRSHAERIHQATDPQEYAVEAPESDAVVVLQAPSEAVKSSATPEPNDDEPALMQRLRGVKDRNPEVCVALAREGNGRYPDSPDAPERSAALVHALASLGRSSEARGEAESMVNHYPDSSWVREIEQFTGARRHRNLRVNDAGELEYYE